PITSTNASGTTFTVTNATTALSVFGGPGQDTLAASGFTLTASQRQTIFEQGSVETITDSSGNYIAPPIYHLTSGTDILTNLPAGADVVATPSTLNASDELVSAGNGVLSLYGVGTYNLKGLAQFSGFASINLNNGGGTLTLPDGQSLDVDA